MSKTNLVKTEKGWEVTDSFDLTDRRRKVGAMRPYLLDQVKKVVDSPRTQERVRLGSMVGFLGHPGKMFPVIPTEQTFIKDPETGKLTMVQLEPVCVTTKLKMEGTKIIHTERFLDTEMGKKALAMYQAGAGGWSWRTGGRNEGGAKMEVFGGFDYVFDPNYVSDDKLTQLNESMQGLGFADEAIHQFTESFVGSGHPGFDPAYLYELEQETTLRFLESEALELQVSELQRDNQALVEAMNKKSSADPQAMYESVKSAFGESPFVVPDDTLRIMAQGAKSKEDVVQLYESFQQYAGVDLMMLGKKREPAFITGAAVQGAKEVKPKANDEMNLEFFTKGVLL